MTYPPGNSGYPPSQQPTQQFSAPTPQYGKVEHAAPHTPQAQSPAAAAAGPSKLPFYLLLAVGVLGLGVFLFSFGPQFEISASDFPIGGGSPTTLGLQLAVIAALLAGLIAAASVLPKQKAPLGIIAAIALLAFLLLVAEAVETPKEVSFGWGFYVVIVLAFIEAAVAIAALLLDSGIIKAPAPKPKYEPQQYGYGQYYGQQPHQGPQAQRPPYQGSYGGYPGQSSGPGGGNPYQQSGPPTPPTGFPTYGQPQVSGSAPTSAVPAQPQGSSSNQSGNSTS